MEDLGGRHQKHLQTSSVVAGSSPDSGASVSECICHLGRHRLGDLGLVPTPSWTLVSSSVSPSSELASEGKRNVDHSPERTQDRQKGKPVLSLLAHLLWNPGRRLPGLWGNQGRLHACGVTLAESWRNGSCQAAQEGPVTGAKAQDTGSVGEAAQRESAAGLQEGCPVCGTASGQWFSSWLHVRKTCRGQIRFHVNAGPYP